jgi:predicted RNase H-like HicB family nuclease
VQALPHLDAGTVRTHISSRCCVNAPKNHPHKWDYFERVERGVYEIRVPYRRKRSRQARATSEPRPAYAASSTGPPVETIHAVARRSAAWFVAECLEVAVVTQGRSLDELATNLQEAIDLHLEGEDPAAFGLVESPRLAITYELPARGS